MKSHSVLRRPIVAFRQTATAILLAAAICLVGLTPGLSWACACGCGVFEVGTSSMFPSGAGGTLFFMYNYADQNQNWSGTSKAPASDNSDQNLRTSFFTLGVQYMFNRSWGVMASLPFADRYFKTIDDSGDSQQFTHGGLGDVRIQGIYTGFSEDMSTGVTAGLKLASGDFTYPNFDRDNELGTGSTDLLLGAYHLGTLPLTFRSRSFSWFAQAQYDLPMWEQQQYHPGQEINAAVGLVHDFGAVGFTEELAPVLNLIGTDRRRDSGANSDPVNTGYDRLLIAPGGEIKVSILRLYADAEIPIYQNFNGNQLAAQVLLKVILSYDF